MILVRNISLVTLKINTKKNIITITIPSKEPILTIKNCNFKNIEEKFGHIEIDQNEVTMEIENHHQDEMEYLIQDLINTLYYYLKNKSHNEKMKYLKKLRTNTFLELDGGKNNVDT